MQGQSRTCNVKIMLQSGEEAGLKNRKRLVHVAASSGPVPVWRARACVRMYVCMSVNSQAILSKFALAKPNDSENIPAPRMYVCAKLVRRCCILPGEREREVGTGTRRFCVRVFASACLCFLPPPTPSAIHVDDTS